jgi:hypothetical protein
MNLELETNIGKGWRNWLILRGAVYLSTNDWFEERWQLGSWVYIVDRDFGWLCMIYLARHNP